MMDNICKTLNIIKHCRTRQIPSVILALDFKKAFDLVEFNYIMQLLHHMNFGDTFLLAMKAIYSKQTARIRINNTNLRRIPINRGTRQGCPLSPLLFALCVELLANMIRNNQELQGVRHANQEQQGQLVCR